MDFKKWQKKETLSYNHKEVISNVTYTSKPRESLKCENAEARMKFKNTVVLVSVYKILIYVNLTFVRVYKIRSEP